MKCSTRHNKRTDTLALIIAVMSVVSFNLAQIQVSAATLYTVQEEHEAPESHTVRVIRFMFPAFKVPLTPCVHFTHSKSEEGNWLYYRPGT